jgi:hypothetical protein
MAKMLIQSLLLGSRDTHPAPNTRPEENHDEKRLGDPGPAAMNLLSISVTSARLQMPSMKGFQQEDLLIQESRTVRSS